MIITVYYQLTQFNEKFACRIEIVPRKLPGL